MPIEGFVKTKLHFFEGKRPDSQWVVIAYDSRSEYLLGCGPEIIFADEPTGNLDSKSGTQVMDIFDRLNQQGKTIVLITHEHGTASYARRVISMRDGEIISDIKQESSKEKIK